MLSLAVLQFDVIYWTGDLPGHNVWNQTQVGGISLQDYITKLFIQYFPDVPVYSAIGNHEGVPVNRCVIKQLI